LSILGKRLLKYQETIEGRKTLAVRHLLSTEFRVGQNHVSGGKDTVKKFLGLIAAIAFVGLLIADQSHAQPAGIRWRGSGGWGPGTPYSKTYDPKTVDTISGEVVKIDTITPRKGMTAGVRMSVKTDKEEVSVHLGPGYFIENQDVKIAPKDKVEVKGSKITFDGKPAIIAMELKKGDEVLKLRDDAGFPVWSAWRRR
jgi:hypothetical protein